MPWLWPRRQRYRSRPCIAADIEDALTAPSRAAGATDPTVPITPRFWTTWPGAWPSC